MRKTNVSLAFVGSPLRWPSPAAVVEQRQQRLLRQRAVRTGQRRSSSSSGAVDGKGAKVGIILPDTTSSPRWVTADPEALKAQLPEVQPRLQHPERRRLGEQDADHRPPDDRRQGQGPDDRRPRRRLGRQDRAGGRQERRHPGRLRPAHPGRRRGALRLLRQRQGRRGAGQDPDPVPAGQEREEREVRRDRRRAHRQQRHAVQAGLRRRAVEDAGLDQGRRADRQLGRPDRGPRVQLDARQEPRHQGRHGRQRHDGRRGDHRPEAAEPQRQGRGLRPGRQRRGPAAHPRR